MRKVFAFLSALSFLACTEESKPTPSSKPATTTPATSPSADSDGTGIMVVYSTRPGQPDGVSFTPHPSMTPAQIHELWNKNSSRCPDIASMQGRHAIGNFLLSRNGNCEKMVIQFFDK